MSAAVFSLRCVPRLSGQVTHCDDLFSLPLDPTPQPICLLWMCLLCLVPYPIILCPGSNNPCSPIVFLTCATLPIIRRPCCLLSSLANFYPCFVPLVSSTSIFTYSLFPHSHMNFFSFLLHPNHLSTSSSIVFPMLSLYMFLLLLSFLILMG